MEINKKYILKEINKLGFPENEVVLTLDEFFANNDNNGSIGINIYPDQPSPKQFYETFNKISKEYKADIFVRIVDIEEPEEWFFSDAMFVVADMTIKVFESAIKNLKPENIEVGWSYGLPVNLDKSYLDKKEFTVIWD